MRWWWNFVDLYSLCSHHVRKFSMCSLTCFPSSLRCSLPQHVSHNVFPQQVSQVLNAFSQHFPKFFMSSFNLFPIAIHFITFPCLSSTLVTYIRSLKGKRELQYIYLVFFESLFSVVFCMGQSMMPIGNGRKKN